ncbi:hypothetical protein [Corynebacterium variabile]|uniref:Uncharacterized protein n=1 Tax=Corynebacterium variabile TaxID=1727 RepID=A0A4Y4C970_9CORY|nr:hypothetical protein [Corynebacterium variabile]GEC87577.1 hypothetical protein CVA01_28910 [Corynebacterium variabile]
MSAGIGWISRATHAAADQYGHPLEWLSLHPLDPQDAAGLRQWLTDQGNRAARTLTTPKLTQCAEPGPPVGHRVLFSIHARPAGGPGGYIVCQNYPNGDREPVGVAYSLPAARSIIPAAHMAHPARTTDLFIVHGDPEIGTVPMSFPTPMDRSLYLSAIVIDCPDPHPLNA